MSVGIKCSFVDNVDKKPKSYVYQGGTFTEIGSWKEAGAGGTPSGDPMHYAYIDAGAKWNDTTNFWELNGLTDLTNDDIRKCYNESQLILAYTMLKSKLRTNFIKSKINEYLSITYDMSFCFGYSLIEVINVGNIKLNNISQAFFGCANLKNIIGEIDIQNCKNTSGTFHVCSRLEDIRLKNIAVGIDLKNCNLLNLDSILYMIQNEKAKSSITITLHTDAYARAMADEQIKTALAEHPNISLASV